MLALFQELEPLNFLLKALNFPDEAFDHGEDTS